MVLATLRFDFLNYESMMPNTLVDQQRSWHKKTSKQFRKCFSSNRQGKLEMIADNFEIPKERVDSIFYEYFSIRKLFSKGCRVCLQWTRNSKPSRFLWALSAIYIKLFVAVYNNRGNLNLPLHSNVKRAASRGRSSLGFSLKAAKKATILK